MFSPVFSPGTPITGSTLTTAYVSSVATSFPPPPNMLAYSIQNDATSTDAIRWAAGQVANVSVGFYYEPSRDSGQVFGSVTLSVVSISSATLSVTINWFTGA